ncbi:hypothetical protein DCAR_0521957 [Daucus carota subsp. sativus]|uniref:Uncharacterized protein n=1 Tax=Daucus carota subsp. sativus TaxID=79200 RepID=A0A162A444_DAUCS|nr:hypothetical protein DCAR_0521957 [Daucus carota subsp. sativus]
MDFQMHGEQIKSAEELKNCSAGFRFPILAKEAIQVKGALARPVFDESGGRLRSSELFAMLPKGVPVPPAGPSPGIN